MDGFLWRVSAPRKALVGLICGVLLVTPELSVIGATQAHAGDDPQPTSTERPQEAEKPDKVENPEEGEKPQEGAEAEVFKNCIKYLGGPGFPDFRGKESWYNSLTISETEGVCEFGNQKLEPVQFAIADVTTILYGQASSRHAGVWVSVGVILAPIALLGLLHKSRKHNVLLTWKSADGMEAGVYLEVQPNHFRRLLNTLAYRTGKPIYADGKDRKWLMTQGVQTQLDPSVGTAEK